MLRRSWAWAGSTIPQAPKERQFILLDKCTNDPTPGRRVAGIQPLPNKPGELFDLAGWPAPFPRLLVVRLRIQYNPLDNCDFVFTSAVLPCLTEPRQPSALGMRPMQVLLDDSVQNAKTYYQTYLREPSPAGDITFTSSEISAVKAGDMDLEQVLTQMKSIPAPPQESGKGRELLIVTHSNPKGLKMPIMKGGQASVMFDVMDTMPKIQEGIDRREAIRTMPSAKAPAPGRTGSRISSPGSSWIPASRPTLTGRRSSRRSTTNGTRGRGPRSSSCPTRERA